MSHPFAKRPVSSLDVISSSAGAERLARRAARRRLLVVLLPALVVFTLLSVRAIARHERSLVEQQATGRRLVTYALAPGETLEVPIEPGTDMLRVVAHAYRRGSLERRPHRVRAMLEPALGPGSSEGRFEVLAPGTAMRVTAEDRDIAVGDPVAFNVDLHGSTAPTLRLRLDSVSEADGILVRLYRRESIGAADVIRRRATLAEGKREWLARRAGELDFADLSPSDRVTLVGARWHRVAPFQREGRRPRSLVVSLAPPEVRPQRAPPEIGKMALDPQDRLTAVASGPNLIVLSAGQDDSGVPLFAKVRSDGEGERVSEGLGRLELNFERSDRYEVEVGAGRPTTVVVAARDPHRVQLSSAVEYDRTAPFRPAVIRAGDSSLLIKVQVRRPVSRAGPDTETVSLVAESSSALSSMAVEVSRSSVDRYAGLDELSVPTERATFYLYVPASARVVLRPPSGELDLSMFELDPRALPIPLRPAGTRLPPDVEGAAPAPPAFVFRLPTNASDFLPGAHGTLRVAAVHGARTAPAMTSRFAVVRVRRPFDAPTVKRDGRTFVATDRTFSVRATGEPLVLPLRFFSNAPATVVVDVDGDEPKRRPGLARMVTLSRRIWVNGEVTATLVLGDDLRPGAHTVTFRADTAAVWVHLPWARRGRTAPQAAWLSGNFDP